MRTRRARAQARGRRFGAIHPARGGGGAHAPARTGVQAGAGGAQAVRRGNRRRVSRHDGRRAQQGFTTRPAGAPRGSPFKRRRAFPKSINRFFPKVPPPPPDVMTNATSPTFHAREASESDALSSHPSRYHHDRFDWCSGTSSRICPWSSLLQYQSHTLLGLLRY